MTESAVKWKYHRPVPQVPSTLLSGGALFMVNDSGILISFNPATGAVIKQGRLKGAIDKYFASPVGADGKVFLVSQDGTVSVLEAKGHEQMGPVGTRSGGGTAARASRKLIEEACSRAKMSAGSVSGG